MSEKIYHKELAAGGWKKLSLIEQMGNIGSEVGRSINWFKKGDKERFNIAFEKALELFDLTLDDVRWKGRKKEIARSREVFCTLLFDTELTDALIIELDSFDKYFLWFAIAANERKYRARNYGSVRSSRPDSETEGLELFQ